MAQFDGKALRRQAKSLLDRHGDSPKKLVLLHTAVALLVPLLVSVISFLLNQQIAKTSGLGGMDARSRLETVQTLLETGVMILLPFWQIGILFAALQWRNGEEAEVFHLTEGFRRFVNVFALHFWSGVLYIGVGLTVFYLSMFIFTATPWATPVMDILVPAGTSITAEQLQEALTPAMLDQLIGKMIPMFVIFGLLYAAVCIPLFYRLRFASYILLEGEGGRPAMLQSFRLTKGSCWQIFKLDLQFWWFYLLLLLSVVISYGDGILTMLGVTLPINSNLCFFLFYALGILLQCVLLWLYEGQRQTTYALAYDALQPEEPDPESEESLSAM